MILVLVLLLIVALVIMQQPSENFDVYRQNLITSANSNICPSGTTLVNCKQSTPTITSTLDSISTICECG